MIVIGLMSGTSADGIDAALVELEGAPPYLSWRLIAHCSCGYSLELREAVLIACDPQRGTIPHLCDLNVWLGQAFGEAAVQAVERAGLSLDQIDLIGSHGQTIWHAPETPFPSTLQLGDGATIAEITRSPVISNFRSRDLAVGGQGAPLVSYVDALLLRDPTRLRVAQNIGGIANLTYLPALNGSVGSDSGALLAFDTGPGNLLIDDAVTRLTQGQHHYDPDGSIAASGQIQMALLQDWLGDPYLQLPPPKTTGREQYGSQRGAQIWQQAQQQGISGEDLIATLTAFTAHSIAQAYRQFLPQFPQEVIVSGGGSRNPTLMESLRHQLQPAQVRSIDELGIPAQAKEALAFGILAYETWWGRPGTLPEATGATRAVILGQITPGGPLPLPPPSPQGQGEIRDRSEPSDTTESPNPATEEIDALTPLEMVERICAEDAQVAPAVAQQKQGIAQAIEAISHRIRQGGRLIYLGAGTSGRLGVLDAAECPPTFSTPPELVIGLIAGGERAIRQAVEGAEDDAQAGEQDLKALELGPQDSVIGIAASGRTPYVLGGIRYARSQGALTVGLTCNPSTPLHQAVDLCIAPQVGPEVIMGSTRLKAGTAQKLVLNLISTGVMIRLGKTYGNLMVDLQPTNAKLRSRSRRILELACDLSPDQAQAQLLQSHGDLKVAIVMTLLGISAEPARAKLQQAEGSVRRAVMDVGSLPQ